MLMFISDDSNWDPSKPEIQAAYKRVGEWFEEHSKSGKITGGEELPDSPGAWLMTTAGRKGIDRLRREARYRDKLAQLQEEPMLETTAHGDERLELIFACCHPALPRESQIALTLRSVVGLTTAEIARAFVTPESTIAQRLVRAKRKIAEAGIPMRVPRAEGLPHPLAGILGGLYLLFNEGYGASASPARRRLAGGAPRPPRPIP